MLNENLCVIIFGQWLLSGLYNVTYNVMYYDGNLKATKVLREKHMLQKWKKVSA